MNKIKVIDLLNMISKGKDVPKKIKVSSFETGILCKEEDYIDYKVFWKDCDGGEHSYWLFDKPTYNDKLNQTIEILNDEVEVIEEDKKIEKVNTYVLCDSDFERMGVHSLKATEIIDKAFEEYSHKINVIIDKVNKGE